MNRAPIRVGLMLVSLLCLAGSAAAQNYTITDLGVLSTGNLGGLTTTDDTDSLALAINASGSVVGYSGAYSSVFGGFLTQHGFLWTPDSKNATTGTLSYLGGLNGVYCFNPEQTVGGITTPAGYALLSTVSRDINSAGQAVGNSYTSPDGTCANAAIHGVVWRNGTVVDLGVPPPGTAAAGSVSYATGINDEGQIVGYVQTGSTADAWLYDGSFHDLGYLPAPALLPSLLSFALPSKINNGGTLVGTSYIPSLAGFLGFVHTGTGPLQATDALGTLGGATAAVAGINNAGRTVGASATAAGGVHAFWTNKSQQMVDLGTASQAPGSNSNGLAINQANNIVGWSDVDLSAVWQSHETGQHAVMWQNGGNLIDLNSLLDPLLQPPFGTSDMFGPSKPCPHITCWELLTATGINDLGQIVGEGLLVSFGQTTGQRHAFLLTPPCVAAGGDTDGDGLCDDWEKNGYTTPDGTFVNLPAMGADPMRKDIFVQADYLVGALFCDPSGGLCSYHTHQPNPDAMALVTQAFANAPVSNPNDGPTGITLHVDCGPDCIMNPLTGETWDALSQAHPIAETFSNAILGDQLDPTCVPTAADSCAYDWTAFDQIKMNDLSASRVPIFHYMLFAHDIGIYESTGLSHTTGKTEGTPGSGFIVSLGCGATVGLVCQVGTSQEQAGTFMHELGHNLGLHHGGLDDINYKPNYLSVMNYAFQMDGLILDGIDGLLDYSRFPSIPDLNENALDETVGLNGGPALANYGTAWYCPGGGTLAGGRRDTGNADGPIDWNCDGNPSETSVQTDINQSSLVFGVLHSSEDWNHLIYTGGGIGGAGVGASTPASDPEDAVPIDSQSPFRVSVVSPGSAQVVAGTSFNETFAIANTGLQSDTYTLSAVSVSNWWTTTGIPSSLTLAGGASQQLTVPVNVSGCISPGTTGQLKLTAASQSHQSIADSVLVTLTVAPNPPGAAVIPNVVGLTQASGQTAIVSAGLTVGTVTTQSSTTVAAGLIISQSPAACGSVAAGTAVALTVSTGPPVVAVPNVVGDTQTAASGAITAAGLVVGTITQTPSTTVPLGAVISQNPAAGASVAPGSAVNLVVSLSGLTNQVPSLAGLSQTQAVAAIQAAGLVLGTVTPTLSSTVPQFSIVSEDPPAGTPVVPGAAVNLVVSAGSRLFTVPSVVGMAQVPAVQNIQGAEFEVAVTRQASTTVPDGYVISQSPAGGASALLTSAINLVISSGGPVTAAVPNVVGMFQGLVENTVFAAGFAVGTVTTQPSNTVRQFVAISQSPPAGTIAAWDTPVSVVFSSGPPTQVTIPNVLGQTELAAITALSRAGLGYAVTTQSSQTVPAGSIASQNPAAGMISLGSGVPVNLVVSGGTSAVPSYSFVREFGESGNSKGQFLGSLGLAIDPASHNILVGDGGGRIQIFDAQGNFQSYFGGEGFGIGWQLQFPGDGTGDGLLIGRADALAIDPVTRNIVVFDCIGERAAIYSSTGAFQSVFGSPGTGPGQFGCPSSIAGGAGIAIDPATENILITDWGNSRVQTFNSAGVYLNQFGTFGSGPGQFAQPGGIAIDAVSHHIVVADYGANTVKIFNSAGVFLSQFGSLGNSPGQFSFPSGVAIDPATHNILVMDQGTPGSPAGGRVQVFDPTGAYLSQFGGPGGGPGDASGPGGLAVDSSGNIVVATAPGVEIFAPAESATSTTLTSSANPATVTQSVTFTATVSGNNPTGTVQFMDGAASLGAPVALTGGTATLTSSTLLAGTHPISAVYSGDSSNSSSTSAVLNEVIRAISTTTVSASANPANAGQAVTVTATVTGNGPTGTVQFLDGQNSLGAPVPLASGTASLTSSTLSVAAHSITALYNGDNANAPSTSAVLNEVISGDTTPPVVTPPANISVPATQAGGATGNAWPALIAFLDGGSAVDSVDPAPVRLAPQVGDAPVNNSTLFPVGTTTVTFLFKDHSGNIGSANATVTVAVGIPRITGSVAGVGTDPSGAIYADVLLTNTGTGNARNLTVNSLVFRTLSGSGTVTYDSTLSPSLPLIIGNLDVGAPITARLYLNVPATVLRLSITENGAIQDVLGTNYNFSTAETFVP